VKKQHKRRSSAPNIQIRIAVIVGIVLLALGGVFVYAHNHKRINLKTAPTASSNSTPTTPQQPTASAGSTIPDTVNATSNPNTTSASGSIDKPTLNKSSGNTGPIPASVLVNFTCYTAAGNNCVIILTDKANSANVIKLSTQVAATTYGQQPFASWNWTSVSGDWSVVAQASSSGASASSDAQELVVQ